MYWFKGHQKKYTSVYHQISCILKFLSEELMYIWGRVEMTYLMKCPEEKGIVA